MLHSFKDFISEVLITKKPMLSNGANQNVYTFMDDGVIKVNRNGKKYNINNSDEWFNIFNKHPKYFPKVLKIHENYIILEKLDTKKAKNEITLMEDDLLKNLPWTSEYLEEEGGNLTHLLYTYIIEDDQYNISYILENCEYKKIFTIWFNYLKNVEDLKIKKSLDVNDGNFGYDQEGNLKMFDI